MAKLKQSELPLKLVQDLGMLGSPKSKSKKRYAYFECPDCKKPFKVAVASIKNGNTKRCLKCKYIKHQTHGASSLKGYKRWEAMLSRCYKPSDKCYEVYGARGISVQENWRTDPNAYLKYITNLPNAFKKGWTVDRADNNGNYEEGNLRWVSAKTQAENSTGGTRGKSKYKGVTWAKTQGKWMVRLMVSGKRKLIGYYSCEVEAAKSYDNYIDFIGMPDKLKNRNIYEELIE